MTRTLRSIGIVATCLIWAAGAAAQSTPATSSQQPSSPSTRFGNAPGDEHVLRRHGDLVRADGGGPAGQEVVGERLSPRHGTSSRGYTQRRATFAGTFGVGIKNRAEIFGSLIVDTRIDRDLRPLFGVEPDFGGIIDRYPRVNQHWTGDNIGDLYLGAKVNILSEYRQQRGRRRGARDGPVADGRR